MPGLRTPSSRVVAFIAAAFIALSAAWFTTAAKATTITIESDGCIDGGTLAWDAATSILYCAGASSQPPTVLGISAPDCGSGTAPAWNASQRGVSCQPGGSSSAYRIAVSLPDCGEGMVTWNATTATLTCKSVDEWLNVDGSTATTYDALTDGLVIMRYLFGLRGTAMTANALGATATRTDPAVIAAYLDSIRPSLDVDGNGVVEALTDGTLIMRYLLGTRGAALVIGAVGSGASNATADGIASKIQSLMP